MLQASELFELARRLADTRVLSVYLDSRVTNPAMKHAWRPRLTSALRETRDRILDKEQRAAFDKAAAFFRDPIPTPGGAWGAPGWAAFVDRDGPAHTAELPTRTETLVAWRDGPAIAPYLRALKQHRAVLVAIADARSARFYRYAYAQLEAVDTINLVHERAPTTSVRTRTSASVAERIASEARNDEWILLGGTLDIAKLVANALPRRLTDRAVVSPFLGRSASLDAIVAAAKHAARSLRSRANHDLVNQVLGSRDRHGAVGVAALLRALHAGAVDLLLLSPRFLSARPDDAEELVRHSLRQGASVELLSGEPAAAVERVGNGVAARLRFPADKSPTVTSLPQAMISGAM